MTVQNDRDHHSDYGPALTNLLFKFFRSASALLQFRAASGSATDFSGRNTSTKIGRSFMAFGFQPNLHDVVRILRWLSDHR
jgi:hypothetical protein